MMRRKISVILIVVICFLLQSTLFSALSFASISPNLLIVVVSSFGFMRGRKEGMWIGLFCGVLMDIFFGEIPGFYTLISVDRVCERNVSESFLSGWYQTSDDPDLRKWLRIEFSNLSASFPSKKKDPFRVLSVPYHDTGDGLYFSNYNRTLFYNTEDQQTPRNDWKKECSKICLIR